MRGIEFRAWDSERKTYDHEELLLAPNGDIWASRWQELCEPESKYIIEPYTGLKDKNGKKIYKGDIIKSSEHIGEVYRQGNGRWVIFCGKDKLHYGDLIVVGELEGETYDLALTLGREYCKVIGNIHENPELLEDRNERTKI